MQNKYCVEATKEFKVNHFGNGTIEESSPPLNREILKMYSSVVWFCQISKGIPKENSNRSQEFFFRQSLLQLQGSSTCNMPGIIFTPASMSAHIAQLDSPSFNCCCFKRSKVLLNVSVHTSCRVPEVSLWSLWHLDLCMAGWIWGVSSH